MVNLWKITGIMRPCRLVKAGLKNNENNIVKPDPDLSTP